jgi:hypothetical protein
VGSSSEFDSPPTFLARFTLREKALKARESKSVRDMLPGAKRPLTASAAA